MDFDRRLGTVYVDDIIVIGNSNTEIDDVVRQLDVAFSLKDLGERSYFLGIEIERCGGTLVLSQHKFILELLTRTGMEKAGPVITPMVLSKLQSEVGTLEYVLVIAPYGVNIKIIAFADEDWGDNLDDRKSISGYCVFVGDNLVS
ncbi:uncharacterized mitochondrial protein AtMg00810-like [Hibiscus syriacus]|uniref:uncharacterized mitochondrial protein AtMg00810-like n=1 Tax=Hibiscus syriacus TaxID=106335 RepID=UPI001924B44D|nr:uncharacterized mitochondrial protein AtMg00810-like [Hibiscus syriacus]